MTDFPLALREKKLRKPRHFECVKVARMTLQERIDYANDRFLDFDYDYDQICNINTDFEAGDNIKVRYDSFAHGRNGGKKRAVLARANGHLMLNSCWKRSNRNAKKQWARHERRVTQGNIRWNQKWHYELLLAIDDAERQVLRIQLVTDAHQVVTRLYGRGGFNAWIDRRDALNVLERFAA